MKPVKSRINRWTTAQLLLGLLLIVSIPGCESLAPQKTAGLNAVRTLRITPDVEMPKKMIFFGLSESMLAGLAGGVGGGAGYAMEAERGGSREASEHYDLPESLRAAFAQEIAKTGKFKIVSGKADAELRLKVELYGFYQAGVMARRVRPVMNVRAQIVARDGSMVFKKLSGTNHVSSKTPAILPEKIRNDRNVGVNAMRVAASVVAAQTAATLK